jgi:hypothetical protein
MINLFMNLNINLNWINETSKKTIALDKEGAVGKFYRQNIEEYECYNELFYWDVL